MNLYRLRYECDAFTIRTCYVRALNWEKAIAAAHLMMKKLDGALISIRKLEEVAE
jgi:hypothetical protein